MAHIATLFVGLAIARPAIQGVELSRLLSSYFLPFFFSSARAPARMPSIA